MNKTIVACMALNTFISLSLLVCVNHISTVPLVDESGQTEPSESVLLWKVLQFWDHPGDSSLDSFECFDILLEIWCPDDDSVFQYRPD